MPSTYVGVMPRWYATEVGDSPAHATPSIGEARLDLENGLGVGLLRRLTRRIEAKLDYRLTAADSNLPSADTLGNRVALSFRASL